jgi:hypothetical protein
MKLRFVTGMLAGLLVLPCLGVVRAASPALEIEGDRALMDGGRDAQVALLPLKRGLMGALQAALTESPEAAVDACKLVAPSIAAGAGNRERQVGRTSQRLRNPANAPSAWLLELLETYQRGGPSARVARVVDLGAAGIGYVEPIYMKKLCITCHGSSVAPALLEHIRELYPEDRAIGFEEGDLRGLFWVVTRTPDSS